jgi:hypothetical protein
MLTYQFHCPSPRNGVKFSKTEVSDVRFEGVCGPDGHGQAPMDGFMASLKANI